MKNKTIRFKLALAFSIMLVLTVGITFLVIYAASHIVLGNTIRDYLISTVEENTNNIYFSEEKSDTGSNVNIPYNNGYLVIDVDFMEVVNDVHTALYREDGTLLYGENPLPEETSSIAFTSSYTWDMEIDGVRYDIYDRKLNLDTGSDETIWIRGIVPETKSAGQLADITHISIVILPILIVLSVLAAYLLTAKMLNPITKIKAAAERISKGDDLKERIDTGGSRDEIGQLADVFNSMLDRLENAFRIERQFTSDASHELRTPTSVMLAQCEYTLEKERTNEEYKNALTVVHRQCIRMKTLVDDMLDYTRMDQQSARYPFEKVNLSDLTEEIARQMKYSAPEGVEYQLQTEPELYISGNKLLITRLIQNLVSNAFKYGNEKGHVGVGLKAGEAHCILEVQDDGTGISPEEQEKIFDRFYRSDNSRSVIGTGLGLSMVKKIAELHGAQIELDSEPGKGSTFRIKFPKI